MATNSFKIQSLQEAADRSPAYADIVPFFIELFRFLDGMENRSGIAFSAATADRKGKSADGLPLVSPDELVVDTAANADFINGAIEVFKRVSREGSDELAALQAALVSGRIDLPAVFKAILERKRTVIDKAAESCGVSPPLFEYIFEIPLKAALAEFAATVSLEEVEGWSEGCCPVCGSRAGMSELSGEEGKRFLHCSDCAFRSPFKRLQCPFCSTEDPEKLSYFLAGEEPVRVDTCKACSRYIKTRDARKGNFEVPLEVEDLLTIHLDLLATKEGFERGK